MLVFMLKHGLFIMVESALRILQARCVMMTDDLIDGYSRQTG